MIKMDETYVIGYVKFDTVKEVKRFIDFLSQFPEEYYLVSDRFIVNAKSIMGIYSLDLTKAVQLVSLKKDDEEFRKKFEEQNFKKE